jgi:hypothetical protein
MPLPAAVRETCLDIMDTLMKRPCAAIFLKPVDPTLDGAPNYLAVIKHPVDLALIRRRLVSDEYPSYQAWSRDMCLIWSNCEKFNGREAIPALLGTELRRNFEKECQRLRIVTLQHWIQTVSDLKDTLDDLLDAPPDLVTNFATISEKPDPNQLKPFTDEELDQFIRQSQLLTSKQDAKRMFHIIRDHEPLFQEPPDDGYVDVSVRSVQTMHALREYVGQRLAELDLTIWK